MDDYKLYIKYKTKYLNLKNKQVKMLGGKINPVGAFPLADEVHFWSRQVAEHLLILHLGLEDKSGSLKTGAKNLQTKWMSFINDTFYSKGVKTGDKVVTLNNEDLSKIGNININKLNNLIDDTIKFNNIVIQTLANGEWIGWIFPALAEHMQSETNYFKRKINGPAFDPMEEIKFINNHNGEEMAATAQLIDPNPLQQPIIDIARSYATKTMAELKAGQSLSGTSAADQLFPRSWTMLDEQILQGLDTTDIATYLQLSIRYSRELSDFADDTGKKIESKQLKSIISSMLGNHVYREFVRFTETLNKLISSNI